MYNKIFCIGRNKTGTTSLEKAFKELGFNVGDQRCAEILQPSYLKRDFRPIIEYCKTAQVFQDFPFSYPYTYKHLDEAFPNSKFILTIRDSEEQWYNSVVKFHSKIFGKGNIPTSQDLKNARYVWKGWIWNSFKDIYKISEDNPYDKEKLIKSYIDYNNEIIEYFKDRPDDFIIINVSKKEDYKRLIKFLDIKSDKDDFPWENKT